MTNCDLRSTDGLERHELWEQSVGSTSSLATINSDQPTHGPSSDSHDHPLTEVILIVPFYKWRRRFRKLLGNISKSCSEEIQDFESNLSYKNSPLNTGLCVLTLIPVCFHGTRVYSVHGAAHFPALLAPGCYCPLWVYRQAGWNQVGTVQLLCTCPCPVNSPNMFRSFQLNQYKLKIHSAFLAKSFKVGHSGTSCWWLGPAEDPGLGPVSSQQTARPICLWAPTTTSQTPRKDETGRVVRLRGWSCRGDGHRDRPHDVGV